MRVARRDLVFDSHTSSLTSTTAPPSPESGTCTTFSLAEHALTTLSADTGGFTHPDHGHAMQLWDFALDIPERQHVSRVFESHRELISHPLVSRPLLARVEEVRTGADRRLPSVTARPAERHGAPGSDPVATHLTY